MNFAFLGSLFNVQCLPCYIRPHYIGHLENWYPEADYVLRKLTMNNPTSYWQRPRSAQREVEHLLYENQARSDVRWRHLLRTQLPRKLLENIAKIYQFDFDLFGYNLTEVLWKPFIFILSKFVRIQLNWANTGLLIRPEFLGSIEMGCSQKAQNRTRMWYQRLFVSLVAIFAAAESTLHRH